MKEAKLRPIPGFPDYFVNDLGEIWSNKQGKMKKRKQQQNEKGYLTIDLVKNKKLYHRFVARLIINAPTNKEVDHIDGDRKNNHISNLRLCTHQENSRNRINYKNTSSKYKGVYLNKEVKKWMSHIGDNYKGIHLGYFENEKDAAKAYNERAKELFGEFARLNEI